MQIQNTTSEDIKVLGRVVSISTEGIVAEAEQVWDSAFRYADNAAAGMDQMQINNLLKGKVKSIENGMNGTLTVNNIQANEITATGDIESTNGDIKTNSGDITSTSGDIKTTSGDIETTSGDLTVGGTSTLGNVNATGNLAVTGNISGANVTVSDNGMLTAPNARITNGEIINLTTTNINSGNLNLDYLTVDHKITANDIESRNNITTKTLNVTSNARIDGNVDIEGSLDVKTNLKVFQDLTVDGKFKLGKYDGTSNLDVEAWMDYMEACCAEVKAAIANFKYTVTYNLTNVTVSHASNEINDNGVWKIKRGETYTTTVTPDSGYTLSTFTVTMTPRVSQVTSNIPVNGNSVTIASVAGDIVVTAIATQGSQPQPTTYTVTYNLDGGFVSESNTTVNAGDSFSKTLQLNSGYELVSLTATGATVSGMNVSNSNVSGNIVITGTSRQAATPGGPYTITYHLTNATSSNNAVTINDGASYTTTITANTDYTLDSAYATMGGHTYQATNGAITISAAIGNIDVYGTASANQLPLVTVFGEPDNSTVMIDVLGGDFYNGTSNSNSVTIPIENLPTGVSSLSSSDFTASIEHNFGSGDYSQISTPTVTYTANGISSLGQPVGWITVEFDGQEYQGTKNIGNDALNDAGDPYPSHQVALTTTVVVTYDDGTTQDTVSFDVSQSLDYGLFYSGGVTLPSPNITTDLKKEYSLVPYYAFGTATIDSQTVSGGVPGTTIDVEQGVGGLVVYLSDGNGNCINAGGNTPPFTATDYTLTVSEAPGHNEIPGGSITITSSM